MKDRYGSSGRSRDNAATTLTPTWANPPTPPSSATVESAAPSKGKISKGRSLSCGKDTLKPKLSKISAEDSTGSEKDLSPYWSDFTAAISSELWLPIETGSPDSGLSLFSGLPSKTAAGSWFSTTRTTAPNRNSPRIFSPSSTPSLAGFTACAATATQSRRIRVYPTREQRRILRLWFDAARWCYNETVARLKADPELKANWKALKTEIIHAVPERLKDTPYQVRSIGVRDACRAMSEVKRRNKELGPGLPGGEYHQLRFRSRKAPKQGCFVPATAVSEYGTYHTLLGRLRMAERLPRDHGDSRLTLHNGQYHLAATMLAQRRVGETQARAVALDPGIRSFLTWFSETDAGHIAPGAFGKIQRLCAHLDTLLSRAKLEKQRFAKRNKYRAAARMRIRISNLIDELHHQTARWLVDHFDIILLPAFETSEMVLRGARKLRAKSVRSMLSYAHYRFQRFLAWKCWQRGKELLLVNEAYTSKTCSWSGEIIPNLGGAKVVRGSDGVVVERDENGARGIFLRALGDTPPLREAAQEHIGDCATGIVSVS